MSALALVCSAAAASADPLVCTLSGYKAAPGLTAAVADNVLTLTWDGDRTQEVRLRLGVDGGAPTMRELAVRRKGGAWAVLAANAAPEFRVVAGMRRMSNQQMQPLHELKVPITRRSSTSTSGTRSGTRRSNLGPSAGAAAIRRRPTGLRTSPGCRARLTRSRARRRSTRRNRAT